MSLTLTLGLALVAARAPGADAEHPAIVVFAAASLTNAMQDLGDAFSKTTSVSVKFSFAASSTLARQIEAGAPADVFFSADAEWMDYLEQRRLIQEKSRANVVGNHLALIAANDNPVHLTIAPHFALAAALGKGRLAIGEPGSVPAGRYAEQSLKALGVWDEVEGRLVPADSVRSALAFVDRGEAPLGIVYETDALVDKGVHLVDRFPDDSHRPIVYPIALTTVSHGAARQFIAFVRGPAGEAAFKSYGFTILH